RPAAASGRAAQLSVFGGGRVHWGVTSTRSQRTKDMNRIASATLTLLLAAGCGIDKADGFRQGVPKSDAVTLKLPASSGAALTSEGTKKQALEGEKAGFYVLTRGVTGVVNGGGAAVLGLVKLITDSQPTKITD